MNYTDSRGDTHLIADMKTVKLIPAYKTTKKKRKNLEPLKQADGSFNNPAHTRRYAQLVKVEGALKRQLVHRNPYNLEEILK
ncbi:hypothetical protein [Vibrio phage 29Fa.3]|nr:hypothetical protein [Vibrio phage 29Fa.3]WKC56079.1 hypothetical protein [Vibrio phage CAU_VPP01]